MSQLTSLPARAISLRHWFRRPLGRMLADAEQAALASQLPQLFGYHLMVIDPPWEQCSLMDSRIPHHVVQRIQPDEDAGAGLVAHTEAWPVMTDSVDAILLPHTLEIAADPHQVLREADRSLIPDGHLVITGFNPRSFWGIRRLFSRQGGEMPWGSRFLSISRLRDWLSLLGFDVLYSRYLFHRPPLQNTRMLERLQFLEPVADSGRMLLAGSYILVARKRTVIMTPLKATRGNRRRLVPVGIPSSSQRNIRRVS